MMNWIWLGAVVAFGVLEAATAALVSIWFVGGAAVALLASFLGAALWLQIALFLAQKPSPRIWTGSSAVLPG